MLQTWSIGLSVLVLRSPANQYFIIAIIWGNSYHDLSAKTTKYLYLHFMNPTKIELKLILMELRTYFGSHFRCKKLSIKRKVKKK